MKPSWHRWWRLLAVAFDASAMALALGGAALLRFGPLHTLELARLSESSISAPWLIGVPIWIGSFAVFGLYSPARWANAVDEARRVLSACLAAPSAFILMSFFLKTEPSRIWVGTGTLAGIACVGAGRRLLRRSVNRIRHAGGWMSRTVIVGGVEAKRLVDKLVLDPATGKVPVATCGFQWGELPQWDLHQVQEAVLARSASSVMVVAEDLERDDVRRAVAVADGLPVKILVVPGLDYALLNNLQVVPVGNEPALLVESPTLRNHQRWMKRSIDIVGSTIGLLLTSPILVALAVAIKLEGPGPILFSQERVGRNGARFRVRKFRSMVPEAQSLQESLVRDSASDARMIKINNDPRVTAVGKILRKYSLDELPQLWNVLIGDMSLVGPRPAQAVEVNEYDHTATRRLSVRPGMSGLWQVSGRSDLDFEDYVRLDVTYVQNWTVLLDAYILLRTLPVMLGSKGAR